MLMARKKMLAKASNKEGEGLANKSFNVSILRINYEPKKQTEHGMASHS